MPLPSSSEVTVRPIRTEADHDWALAELETLIDAEPGTPEYDRLEVLGLLVHSYEQDNHRLPPADPADAIRFRMEQGGHSEADLAHVLGGGDVAADILTGRRPLSLELMRALHREWGVPYRSLLGD